MSFRITHSLLNKWEYSFSSEEKFKEFVDYLGRKPTKQTQAMLDGIEFENMVYANANGALTPEDHKWYAPVTGIGSTLKDAVFQVPLGKDVTINGIDFHLFGILDALRASEIYDVKFSKTYDFGKYRASTQHPMYFALCPEAYSFTYLVSDGKDVFRETYFPYDTPPIEITINHFMKDLERKGLVDLYCKNYKTEF